MSILDLHPGLYWVTPKHLLQFLHRSDLGLFLYSGSFLKLMAGLPAAGFSNRWKELMGKHSKLSRIWSSKWTSDHHTNTTTIIFSYWFNLMLLKVTLVKLEYFQFTKYFPRKNLLFDKYETGIGVLFGVFYLKALINATFAPSLSNCWMLNTVLHWIEWELQGFGCSGLFCDLVGCWCGLGVILVAHSWEGSALFHVSTIMVLAAAQ